jgi:hypothetical protein
VVRRRLDLVRRRRQPHQQWPSNRATEQQPHWSNGVGPPCESPVLEDRLQFGGYRSGWLEFQYSLRFMAARLV